MRKYAIKNLKEYFLPRWTVIILILYIFNKVLPKQTTYLIINIAKTASITFLLLLKSAYIYSEPLRMPEDFNTNGVRRRRSDEHDGLALSREIFRNITKKLRENIKREGATDSEHLVQSKSSNFIYVYKFHNHNYTFICYYGTNSGNKTRYQSDDMRQG